MKYLLRAAAGLAGLAITTTGLALPASAEEPGPTPAPTSEATTEAEQLAEHAEEDPALHVADDGTVYAADVWRQVPEEVPAAEVEATEAAEAEALASYSLADTFRMHSRPGASRTVYLDFDGGSLLSSNAWVASGLTNLLYPGWSTDTLPTFSSTERTAIQEVWARVAEDFAAFDIDVTTEEPPAGGLWRSSSTDQVYGTRVAFTSGDAVRQKLCAGSCGGVAWVGTFNSVTNGETRSPAWVFPTVLSNRAKYMADAASHEVGHNLGLSHDGTATSGYYGGTNLWGPIMGSPYTAGITQWSRGQYSGANNQEDDLVRMAGHGAPTRPDEAGGSAATAAPSPLLAGGTGVITSQADQDWFTLNGCSGTVSAQASPAGVGPNVDLRLQVIDASGTVRASNAPATTRVKGVMNGLSAAVSLPLSGGPYYLAVSGAGSGTNGVSGWATGGYDAYGSIGTYRLSATGCTGNPPPPPPPTEPQVEQPPGEQPPADDQPPVVQPPAPQVYAPGAPARPIAASGALGGYRTIRARWTPPLRTGGAAITGYVVKAYRLSAAGTVLERRTSQVQPASARRLEWRLPRGRWAVRVKARNRVGWGALSARSVGVHSR